VYYDYCCKKAILEILFFRKFQKLLGDTSKPAFSFRLII